MKMIDKREKKEITLTFGDLKDGDIFYFYTHPLHNQKDICLKFSDSQFLSLIDIKLLTFIDNTSKNHSVVKLNCELHILSEEITKGQ